MTLLLTRPAQAAADFAGAAEARLGRFTRVVISPLLNIEPIVPFPPVPMSSVLAFTSANAVQIAAAHSHPSGQDVWCVGERTAEAARDAGWTARSAAGDVSTLAAALIDAAPERPVVHLSGTHQAGDLVGRLREAGLTAHRCAIYDQTAAPLTSEAQALLADTGPVLAPVFSPRTSKLLWRALPSDGKARLLTVFLSEAVAEKWGEFVPPERIAAAPDRLSMISAMARAMDAFSGS